MSINWDAVSWVVVGICSGVGLGVGITLAYVAKKFGGMNW